MNPLLSDMPLFVELAKRKSFTRAADALEIGISTLSRRIKTLEGKLGVPLFQRDTHTVELTEAGERLLEHCEFILDASDNALETVTRQMRAPAGRVRVSMYADTYHGLLRGAFSAFADRWPDIQVNVTFSEDPAHLMTEPYDVTFRIEPLPDSAMVARKIYTIDPAVYASPKFLERHRAPEEPRDLLDLPCITLARFGNMWELRNRDRVETLYIKPRFVFSSVPLMTELMVGGHGAGLVQRKIALPYLETGRLVQLLPEWNGPRHDLFILTAGRQVPQRVRIFVDFIRDFLETAKTPQPDR